MDYKKELNRFGSFEKYPETEIFFLRMSQSGFYYTGEGSVVRCYSCGLEVREWRDGETVAELHRRLAPQCPFLNGSDVENRSTLAHGVNDENGVTRRPTHAHEVGDTRTPRKNDADTGLKRQQSDIQKSNLTIESTENVSTFDLSEARLFYTGKIFVYISITFFVNIFLKKLSLMI